MTIMASPSNTPNSEKSDVFNEEKNANEEGGVSPELISEVSIENSEEKDDKNGSNIIPKPDYCADVVEVSAEEQNNKTIEHFSSFCNTETRKRHNSESIEEVAVIQLSGEEIVLQNSEASTNCLRETNPHVGAISPVSITSDSSAGNEKKYRVKWVNTGSKALPIITQNNNGSCPSLAIINYLLLNERISLVPSTAEVTSSFLMTLLGDCLFETIPKDLSDHERGNYEKKIDDAISMFPKLLTGLDVNVGFTNITHFEYTPSLEVFDLLCIPLYHGWVVDPSDTDVAKALGNATYNQVIEKCISHDKANMVLHFLEATATQMTYYGLSQLVSTLPEGHMGILFRNNHFHLLFKRKGRLYLLMTDEGYLNEPGVVWETLDNIEGNSSYLDANFRFYEGSHISSKTPIQLPSFSNTEEQIESDYMLALALNEKGSEEPDSQDWTNLGLTDHEIAVKLQGDEDKGARSLAGAQSTTVTRQQQQQPPSNTQQNQIRTSSSSSSVIKEKKDSSCVIM